MEQWERSFILGVSSIVQLHVLSVFMNTNEAPVIHMNIKQTVSAFCFCPGLLLSADYCSRRWTDAAPLPMMPLERRLPSQWSSWWRSSFQLKDGRRVCSLKLLKVSLLSICADCFLFLFLCLGKRLNQSWNWNWKHFNVVSISSFIDL